MPTNPHQSPRLALPFVAPAQAQKHIPVNEALRRLDILAQITVASRHQNVPPEDPAEGEAYIAPTGAAGAWAGADNQIHVFQDGTWEAFAPQTGWTAWVEDENDCVIWDGVAWKKLLSALTSDCIAVNSDTNTTLFAAKGSNAIEVETASNSVNPVIAFKDGSPGQVRIGAFNFLNGTGGAVGQLAYFFNETSPADQQFRVLVNGGVRLACFGDGSVVVGSPAGGRKGAGALNAQAVYDDNALLSCYVFDQAIDGCIREEKWDAKAPSGAHDGARKFAARIGGAHDPLTLDGYAAHWREKRHLTAMPNERRFSAGDEISTGAWIQRLLETVETQAVLIEALNQRCKEIEAKVDGAYRDPE